MKREVAAELASLKARRDRMIDQARVLDREIGRLAGQAVQADQYTTKSGIGRLLGISHTHVGNLIAAAAGTSAAPQAGIPVLNYWLAGNYVRERGAQIVRSISGFHAGDVLFRSGLDPRLFSAGDDGGSRLRVPNMIWQLDSGEWLGVSEATVGYGGTGCGYSEDALVRAGVKKDTAEQIVQWRFCDAAPLDDPTSWRTSTAWPVYARSIPRVVGDRIIVNFGEGLSRLNGRVRHLPPPAWAYDGNGVDRTGFYPSATKQTKFEAWLDFLDEPDGATWTSGPRVARVFLDEAAALAQGFVVLEPPTVGPSRSIPQIVIEQGHVQLWGHFYRPLNRNQLLPDEAYEALGQAQVYPAGLAERDLRNTRPLLRLLHNLKSHDRDPLWIDISDDASTALSFTPANPNAD